ncbi:MAG: aminoglycoside phosphotransferase family protein [Halioglobus sp.]
MAEALPPTPKAELLIDAALANTLLESQHPDLLGLSIEIVESGWDNAMIRLGSDLALRLPRRSAADPLVLSEQLWLPVLAPRLTLPVPTPLRIGTPTAVYPFHWSVLHWLPGEASDVSPPDSSEASRFAQFLRSLHDMKVDSYPPKNPVRDCPLTDKKLDTEKRLEFLGSKTDWITPQIMATWNAALAARIDLPTSWIHGDLHSRNVLVFNHKLSAIIDWGDMCGGDPATDLAAIWSLFEDEGARNCVLNAYGVSASTKARAMGWAVFFGAILGATGLKDSPRHAQISKTILERVHRDYTPQS